MLIQLIIFVFIAAAIIGLIAGCFGITSKSKEKRFHISAKGSIFDSGENPEDYARRITADFSERDNLGKAADARQRARDAIKGKNFDDAWKCYHEEKEHFFKHASQNNFTPAQVVALDGTVSKSLANILRLEKRDREAFVHVIYWISSSTRETKEQGQKLIAYFNRCKFQQHDLGDVRKFICDTQPIPDLREIQNFVMGLS